MERNLNSIRLEINDLDEEMKKLFIKRMNLVKEVIEYKKENNLEILDISREQEAISRNSSDLINSEFYEYYIQFLKDLMNNSKNYQKNILQNSSKNLSSK